MDGGVACFPIIAAKMKITHNKPFEGCILQTAHKLIALNPQHPHPHPYPNLTILHFPKPNRDNLVQAFAPHSL